MWLRVWAAGILCGALASAQTSPAVFIDTIAGAVVPDSQPAKETPLIQPQAVWVATNGDIYISDGNFLVHRVRGSQSQVIAGGGTVVDDGGGINARAAKFDFPNGLVTAGDGTVYVTDVRHHRVRRITPDGRITTVVGRGTAGYSGDGGPGVFAELDNPNALALSPNGDLMIADTSNSVIRRWDPRTGRISTFAGTGDLGNTGDGGPASQATFGSIRALAFDSGGNLYVGDIAHYVIRRIAPDGTITRFAGTGELGSTGDGGPATEARIGRCYGLAADSRGNLFLSDADSYRVRVINSQRVISTYAGGADKTNNRVENVAATALTLDLPLGLAVDAQGNLFIAESDSHLIRRVDVNTRNVTTVAGATTLPPSPLFDNVKALTAPIFLPSHIAVDSRGNVYFAENGSYRIRRIDPLTGVISTVVGDGREAGTVGATDRSLGRELGISIDPQGRLLIADRNTSLIRRYDLASNTLSTLVDLNRFTWERDNPRPTFAIGDTDGNTYISEWMNDVVLRLSPEGQLFVIAGTEGTTGYKGDGGPGLSAEMNSPEGLAFDGKGGLLVCDSGNHVVRRIDIAKRIIDAFAGDGIDNFDYDGFDAKLASLRKPVALAIDSEGYVYIADDDAHAIRFVAPDGIINTLAGSDESGFAGDGGLAQLALMDEPKGLAVYGNTLIVSDNRNYRLRQFFVREVENALRMSPGQLTFRAAEGGDPPSEQLLVVNSSYLGLNLGYSIGGGTDNGGAWLYVDELEGETPNAIIVSVDTTGLTAGRYTGRLEVEAANGSMVPIPIELIVTPPGELRGVKLSSDWIQITAPTGGAESSVISVTGVDGRAVPWQVRLITNSPWLEFTPQAGTTPTNTVVRVNAANLAPGVYTAVGYIDVPDGTSTLFVVTATVSESRASMVLDRNTLVFEAVQGTTSVADQTLSLVNTGTAPMQWSLAIPSDRQWVRASVTEGSVDPGTPAARTVISVNPAGLDPGDYTAILTARAPDALGAPQSINVRLRVRASGSAAAPIFDRTALAFFGSSGSRIQDQLLSVGTTGGSPLTFSATARTSQGGKWLSVTPGEGSLQFSAQRYQLRVSVTTDGLTDDQYRETSGCPKPAWCGQITFTFSDGSVQEVSVLLVLRPGGGSGAASGKNRFADCSPATQLVLVPTLTNNFSARAGWPVPIRAQVLDDCGGQSTTSNVTATFSNGDPPLTLANLRNGEYSATWTPIAGGASSTVTVRALHPALATAEWRSSGSVSSTANDPPAVSSGGIMNAATRRRAAVVAPRQLVVIQGANFPDNMGDVRVLVGGETATVVSTKPDEVQAVIPGSVASQRSASLMVSARGYVTSPVNVAVVVADPGLFPLAEGTTVSPGASLNVTGTGFGAVDGERNPTNPIAAKLGDRDVTVESAKLSEDGPGRYQLSIKIPDDVTGELQLTVTQNGVVSNSIPVRIQ